MVDILLLAARHYYSRKLEGRTMAEISTSMARSLRALSDPMQRGLAAGKEVGHAGRGDHGRRP